MAPARPSSGVAGGGGWPQGAAAPGVASRRLQIGARAMWSAAITLFATRDRPGTWPYGRVRLMPKTLALFLVLLLPAVAGAAVLDLPVQRPGAAVGSPSYAGDLVELRLAPLAARNAHPRVAGPTRARQALRLGLASVDAVSASLGGCVFEPEFTARRRPRTPPSRTSRRSGSSTCPRAPRWKTRSIASAPRTASRSRFRSRRCR